MSYENYNTKYILKKSHYWVKRLKCDLKNGERNQTLRFKRIQIFFLPTTPLFVCTPTRYRQDTFKKVSKQHTQLDPEKAKDSQCFMGILDHPCISCRRNQTRRANPKRENITNTIEACQATSSFPRLPIPWRNSLISPRWFIIVWSITYVDWNLLNISTGLNEKNMNKWDKRYKICPFKHKPKKNSSSRKIQNKFFFKKRELVCAFLSPGKKAIHWFHLYGSYLQHAVITSQLLNYQFLINNLDK